ncbi:hypothetical protein PR048_026262 [Dryococelus australis]|uniref:Uncharacterized protein n=1 Tax=Dryococelus australis TaxID=614101 RepID=A0ABQ9GKV4_9NEOP|nr:hypothetical protein PR048_026262 [Dryococelus australis]
MEVSVEDSTQVYTADGMDYSTEDLAARWCFLGRKTKTECTFVYLRDSEYRVTAYSTETSIPACMQSRTVDLVEAFAGACAEHCFAARRYNEFTVTSHCSEALLKFYFQDIPPASCKLSLFKYRKLHQRTTHRIRLRWGGGGIRARTFQETYITEVVSAEVLTSRNSRAEIASLMNPPRLTKGPRRRLVYERGVTETIKVEIHRANVTRLLRYDLGCDWATRFLTRLAGLRNSNTHVQRNLANYVRPSTKPAKEQITAPGRILNPRAGKHGTMPEIRERIVFVGETVVRGGGAKGSAMEMDLDPVPRKETCDGESIAGRGDRLRPALARCRQSSRTLLLCGAAYAAGLRKSTRWDVHPVKYKRTFGRKTVDSALHWLAPTNQYGKTGVVLTSRLAAHDTELLIGPAKHKNGFSSATPVAEDQPMMNVVEHRNIPRPDTPRVHAVHGDAGIRNSIWVRAAMCIPAACSLLRRATTASKAFPTAQRENLVTQSPPGRRSSRPHAASLMYLGRRQIAWNTVAGGTCDILSVCLRCFLQLFGSPARLLLPGYPYASCKRSLTESIKLHQKNKAPHSCALCVKAKGAVRDKSAARRTAELRGTLQPIRQRRHFHSFAWPISERVRPHQRSRPAFHLVSLLASHQGEPGSIHSRVTPGFSHVRDRGDLRRLSTGYSRGSPVSPAPSFRRCSILTSLRPRRLSGPRYSAKLCLHDAEEYPVRRTLAGLQKSWKKPQILQKSVTSPTFPVGWETSFFAHSTHVQADHGAKFALLFEDSLNGKHFTIAIRLSLDHTLFDTPLHMGIFLVSECNTSRCGLNSPAGKLSGFSVVACNNKMDELAVKCRTAHNPHRCNFLVLVAQNRRPPKPTSIHKDIGRLEVTIPVRCCQAASWQVGYRTLIGERRPDMLLDSAAILLASEWIEFAE